MDLKREIERVAEFKMIASMGELVRTVVREYIYEVIATPEYKMWLERKEQIKPLLVKKEKDW